MTLVFCSGLKRSGSTWSYNVARLLMLHATDPARLACGYVGEYQRVERAIEAAQGKCDSLLIKFHFPTENLVTMVARGQAKNIYTVRHPLQALASELEFFGGSFERALTNIECGLQSMDIWRTKPGTLFIRFDEIIESPDSQIESIARHLGISVDPMIIRNCTKETSYRNMKRLAESLPEERLVRIGGMTYDRLTLLHVGHAPKGVSRDWRTVLNDTQTEIASARLHRWIKEYGAEGQDNSIP